MDLEPLLRHVAHLELELKLETARDLLSAALKQNPTWQLLARRAEIFKQAGDTRQAEIDLRAALACSNEQQASVLERARLQSRLILTLWSRADWPVIERELQTFQEQFASSTPPAPPQLSKVQRPLRVGYLSPDFRICSAAMLLEAYFSRHPQEGIELYAYDLINAGDPAQQAFQSWLPHWRNLAGLDLDRACSQIEADQVDVLIDLAGHTSLSGLAILGRWPAPRQITGLTFNGPVGLPGVYRLSDPIASPSPQLEEELLYLPSWITLPYQPDIPGRDASALPQQGRHLGCAHHPGRLSPQTVALWTEIMQACPETQLHLKHRFYQNDWCRERLRQFFVQRGIHSERLHFYGGSAYLEYLNFYHLLDLVLDPFPYHGGLVSCDALWMGLPIVTLDSWTRGGVSLLKQVAYDYGIATSPKDYLQRCLEILQNRSHRYEAAQYMRSRMQASALCQPARLSRSILAQLRSPPHPVIDPNQIQL